MEKTTFKQLMKLYRKAIADQLRHEDQKTTVDFYIGPDPDFQRSQNELLTLPQAQA